MTMPQQFGLLRPRPAIAPARPRIAPAVPTAQPARPAAPVTPGACTTPLRVVGGSASGPVGAVGEVRRPDLTEREVEVLLTWLRTDSKAEAGRMLYVAGTTVHTHLERIRAKYDAVGRPARTKAALAARAIQDGYVALWDL
ncbi:hypothetical protein MINS_13290 [Mycolicibacterium insubricum]|jgi:DNA-binding CsgD family transcriptional regulator|uniref:LuxR C-terminal-related transcriptional regulator n=1 Tax=Mycolicibacterium insubricum TaxID=444597 RepID=UPI00138C9840|nr:helix-turn-helix transcriptional regulator [Mycolicibacterium insubricum]BBZ65900.1 hypothetical protein MINS_13290 [Mycolicibacterium insubricum]